MFMPKYTYICWIHTDTMNNRRRKTSLTKYLPLTLLQGFEKVVWGFTVRGSWRSNITAIFWPQTYGRHVVSFLFFWCSTGALGSTLLGAGFLYCSLSASSLDPNSSGLHLIPTGCNSTGRNWTQLSYIIVRRPLDFWNPMFNRHQTEITVMQFRGHSLPVHHSVVAQWDLHLVPYYQP